MQRTLVISAALSLGVVSTANAQEEPPPPFGLRGQKVITSAIGLDVEHSAFSETPASQFSVDFAPAIDIFVARYVSIGAEFEAYYLRDEDSRQNVTKTSELLFGFRLGVAVPLGRYVS